MRLRSSTASQKEILRVHNICYAYPGLAGDVVRNISFSIRKGQFVGIIGPNGGGKTTLIKIILGILRQTSGTVEIFGRDSQQFNDRHRIGYVSQHIGTYDPTFPANVAEIVRMGLTAQHGIFHHHAHHDTISVRRALDLVGMGRLAGVRISRLSGGQQQRVLIARALVSSPDILILDEPTAEVDIEAQRDFYALLTSLNKKLKLTILLISHDIGLLLRLVDTVVCLHHKLLCIGPPSKTLPNIEEMFEHHTVLDHHCHHRGMP